MKNRPCGPQVDPGAKLEFRGAKVTSDDGLLIHREPDETLGHTALAKGFLQEPRTGRDALHTPAAVLRQAAHRQPAGYDDTNDAERLRVDPALRQVVGGGACRVTIIETTK